MYGFILLIEYGLEWYDVLFINHAKTLKKKGAYVISTETWLRPFQLPKFCNESFFTIS